MENNLLVDSSATQEKTSVDQTSTDSKSGSDSKDSSSKTSTDSKDSDSSTSADTKKSNSTNTTKTNDTKSAVSNSNSKNSTKIVDSGSKITKGNSYKVTLKDANGKVLSNKKIIFIFGPNNITYTRITDSKGIASITINAAAGKTYLLRFFFLGDDDYSASSGSVNLKVQSKTTISGSGSSITRGNAYKVYLKDSDGKALANKKVVFTFGPNGSMYTRTTDSNGMVSLSINAAVGSYALKYAFGGDDYYFASSGSVNLKVQSKTSISGSGSSITKGNAYKVYLKDSDGKALANKKITFIFGPDGTKYTRTTDKNGMVSLTINAAAGKTYSLSFSFDGDDYYLASSGSVNLKVQSKTSISGSGSSITRGNAYKVYLKDADGKALANQKITFIFGPKSSTYTRTTDKNGMVSLSINAAVGTYALKYSFGGDDYYFASSGSVNLKVQSKTAISGSGTSITRGNAYKVYLKDSDGKALKNKIITFIFGPKSSKYTRTTDSNGMVSLSINAAVGTYALKYSFGGDEYYFASSGSVNLKVQSKTAISGSGTSITKGNAYKVYLKDSDGKALANQKITFIFGPDSTKYTRTTDKNGMASLTINAAAGKTYKLTFKFDGAGYYLSSNGSVNLKVNAPPNRGNASQYKKGLNEIESLSDAELAKYLKASGYDAINSAIQTLAKKLTAGKTSVWDKATAIFNYVRDDISYSFYSNSQKGAAKTLSSGTGNCCDQANLVVALCRAAGIPARFSHAKNCKFNSGLVAGHVWAQIYVDGVWYSADATSRYNSLGNIKNWNTNSFTNLNQYIHLPF